MTKKLSLFIAALALTACTSPGGGESETEGGSESGDTGTSPSTSMSGSGTMSSAGTESSGGSESSGGGSESSSSGGSESGGTGSSSGSGSESSGSGSSGSESSSSGGTGLGEGFEEELTQQAGCSDMVVYASSPDGTLGLSMYLRGLDVNGVSEETEFNDIPYDEAQWLEVRVGTDVTAQECSDVGMPIVVDELWVPTGGTIDVVITPGGGGPLADVTLNDFVFEYDGATVAMPSYTFTDVLVGWFPG